MTSENTGSAGSASVEEQMALLATGADEILLKSEIRESFKEG